MKKTFEFYGRNMVIEDISSTNIRHTRLFSIGSPIYIVIAIIFFIGMITIGVKGDAGVMFYVIMISGLIGSIFIHDLFSNGRVVEITLRNGSTFKSDRISKEDAELLKNEILRKVNG